MTEERDHLNDDSGVGLAVIEHAQRRRASGAGERRSACVFFSREEGRPTSVPRSAWPGGRRRVTRVPRSSHGRWEPAGNPLFLQAKEAQESALERFVGESQYTTHGQRVVAQRLMQAATSSSAGSA